MIKKISVSIFMLQSLFFGLLYSSTSHAAENDKLIRGCNEALRLYKNSSENMVKYASLTTSVSDALLAGYCMGTLEEYLNQERCYHYDHWRDLAAALVSKAGGKADARDVMSDLCRYRY